jgi:Spy/CpxP family protein refolding chaperone
MKNRILIVVLIISLGVNLGLIMTFVFRIGETKTYECGWHHPALRQKLHLTPEQIKILENKRADMQKRMIPMQEELKRKRLELLALQKSENLDIAKLDSLLAVMSRLQYEIERAVFLHMNEVKGIFSKDQQVQFFEQVKRYLCPESQFYKECERR